MTRILKAVDLFCGAGGTSQGAEQSGAAKVITAVNHWQRAVETHSANFPHCRHINRPEWIRSIVAQCKAAGVPCFVKQLGGNVVTRNDMVEDHFNSLDTGWPDPEVEHDIHGFRENYQGADCRIRLQDKKGGDWNEWPEDLRVREFPEVARA
jgi:site-specific DNA-cytosine methylase